MSCAGCEGNKIKVGLSTDIVIFYSKLHHFSGVNMTTDNRFTRSNLAADSFKKQITWPGAMSKNRQNFGLTSKYRGKKKVRSNLFGFSDKQTVALYVCEKNKAIMLLLTMHNNNKIDKDTGLRKIIVDYNANKAA